MFQFYQNAFHARKTYEDTPPDSDDIHIMMDIYGVENLIGPRCSARQREFHMLRDSFYG